MPNNSALPYTSSQQSEDNLPYWNGKVHQDRLILTLTTSAALSQPYLLQVVA